jgi:hypothetical protein
MNKYVLDADVLIQAKNDFYGMDFCPAFWPWLIEAHNKGLVCSIEPICEELKQTATDEEDEDELSKWVKSEGSCLFHPLDQLTVSQLPAVATWSNSQRYTPSAVSKFLGCADMYIVAFGLAHKFTVVTHEKPSESVNKLKIPDACRGLNVKCIRLFEMLRAEGVRFVLDGSAGGGA